MKSIISINVKIKKRDLSDTNSHKNCMTSTSIWDEAEGRNRTSVNPTTEKTLKQAKIFFGKHVRPANGRKAADAGRGLARSNSRETPVST